MSRRENEAEKTEEEKKLDTDHSAILSAIATAKQELEQLGKDKQAIIDGTEKAKENLKALYNEDAEMRNTIVQIKNRMNVMQADFDKFEKEIAEKRVSLTASLPDVDKALAELEALKQPIRDEINRLSKIQLESQESLKAWQEKVAAAEEEHHSLTVNIKTASVTHDDLKLKISGAQAELNGFAEKKKEYDNLAEGIETRSGILFDTNKKLTDAENRLAAVNSDITAARAELLTVEEEKKKVIADADERMKALATLEARVDQKIEVFKQYKEKFTVDELARMKIDTKTP